MTSSFQVKIYFAKRGRIPLLSLNELGEKLQAITILGRFVNKLKSNSHWLIFL